MGLRERLLELVNKGHEVEVIDEARISVNQVVVVVGDDTEQRLKDDYTRRQGGVKSPIRGKARSQNKGKGFDARDRSKKKGVGGHPPNPDAERFRRNK